MQQLANVIVNVDMDGVIAKWNEHASAEEVAEPGYFLAREPEPKTISLIHRMLDAGIDVRILSAVYQDGHSANEKEKWLKKNGLENIPRTFVPYGEYKFKYVDSSKSQFLIDDFGKNLRAWMSRTGFTAIKFYNGINDRPRIEFDDNNTAKIVQDSWVGPSISHKMDVEDMFAVVIGQLVKDALIAA